MLRYYSKKFDFLVYDPLTLAFKFVTITKVFVVVNFKIRNTVSIKVGFCENQIFLMFNIILTTTYA
jgi:hypothetical protein